MKVRVICLNEKGRPNEIPIDKWPIEGEQYHIKWIYKQLQQKGIQGVELAEFDISECVPYNCYDLRRFGIFSDDMNKLMQLFKDCTEMDSIEVGELLSLLGKEQDNEQKN